MKLLKWMEELEEINKENRFGKGEFGRQEDPTVICQYKEKEVCAFGPFNISIIQNPLSGAGQKPKRYSLHRGKGDICRYHGGIVPGNRPFSISQPCWIGRRKDGSTSMTDIQPCGGKGCVQLRREKVELCLSRLQPARLCLKPRTISSYLWSFLADRSRK